jgi:acyl-CoA thioester hydrolase
MGVAYHGNYFAWFEVGRTDLLRETGVTYKDLERQGLRLPVVETEARFLKPALYDDVLEIATRVAAVRGASICFEYEVRRADAAAPLATARTMHAAVDREGRPMRLPMELRKRLT